MGANLRENSMHTSISTIQDAVPEAGEKAGGSGPLRQRSRSLSHKVSPNG
jgi:hypothetical protein